MLAVIGANVQSPSSNRHTDLLVFPFCVSSQVDRLASGSHFYGLVSLISLCEEISILSPSNIYSIDGYTATNLRTCSVARRWSVPMDAWACLAQSAACPFDGRFAGQ